METSIYYIPNKHHPCDPFDPLDDHDDSPTGLWSNAKPGGSGEDSFQMARDDSFASKDMIFCNQCILKCHIYIRVSLLKMGLGEFVENGLGIRGITTGT